MRLINTFTLDFEEFTDVPKYAILSHTWGDEEISFKEMRHRRKNILEKEGYRKLDMVCQIAHKAGIKYAWVDTCCIDKSNNVELTEAINSMYNWYRRSEICYAYLSDLREAAPLRDCRWFTRGWTLQELIAPKNIFFFDQNWKDIGSKDDLVDELSEITGITRAILQNAELLPSMSVAQRMSWAAHRKTTRIEDTAYCLLGIFGVHMPLIYGSENQAFRGLQQEIIKLGSDFSIFAWSRPPLANQAESQHLHRYCGVLAASPSFFSNCRSFTKGRPHAEQKIKVSNGGIKTRMLLIELTPETGGYRYILPLDCSDDPNIMLGVRLRKCGPNEFVRENPYEVEKFEKFGKRKLLLSNIEKRHLLIDIESAEPNADSGYPHPDAHNFVGQRRIHALQLKLTKEMWLHPLFIRPGHRFDAQDQAFFITGDPEYDSGMLRLRGSLTPPMGGLRTEVAFDCLFYALGWSSTNIDSLQCTLLDQRLYVTELAEFHSDVAGWDYHREQCLMHLIHHEIPKASSVRIQIPGTDTWAYVSFTPRWVDDQSVCRKSFWRIEFSCNFYNGISGVPKVEYGKWYLRDPSHWAEKPMSNISTTEPQSRPKCKL
jgi:hypothetical protein